MKKINTILVISLIILSMLYFTSFSQSQDEAEFYKGKTITLATPHGAGGGFDTYCRLIAPFLEKYLPGASVIVEPITGGGGIVGRNKLYKANPDGLTIGLEAVAGMMFAEVAEMEGVLYKTNDFVYFGRVVNEPHIVAVSPKSPFKKLEDLKGNSIKFAFSGVGSDDYYATKILCEALGINLIPVTGYDGSAEASIAVAKGECDATTTTYGSVFSLIESKDMIPILQISEERHTTLPNIPSVFEVLEDKDARRFVTTMINLFELDRVVFGPPGISDVKTAVYRDAFSKLLQDKEFIETAAKSKRDIVYLDGENTDKKVKEAWAEVNLIKRILMETK